MKTVTRGFSNILKPEFQAPLSKVLEYLVPLFAENY